MGESSESLDLKCFYMVFGAGQKAALKILYALSRESDLQAKDQAPRVPYELRQSQGFWQVAQSVASAGVRAVAKMLASVMDSGTPGNDEFRFAGTRVS